jgi:hypothetical protein
MLERRKSGLSVLLIVIPYFFGYYSGYHYETIDQLKRGDLVIYFGGKTCSLWWSNPVCRDLGRHVENCLNLRTELRKCRAGNIDPLAGLELNGCHWLGSASSLATYEVSFAIFRIRIVRRLLLASRHGLRFTMRNIGLIARLTIPGCVPSGRHEQHPRNHQR